MVDQGGNCFKKILFSSQSCNISWLYSGNRSSDEKIINVGKKVFIQIYKKIRYRFTKPERDMLRKGERLYKVDVMCIYFKISSSQLGQCFSLQIID